MVEMINNKGNKQKIWIWDYRGLPLRYDIYDSNDELIERVEFKSLAVNHLKDSDVNK